MNFVYVLLAICFVNAAAGRAVFERNMDQDVKLCGAQMYAMLGHICSGYRYNPEALRKCYTAKRSSTTMSLSVFKKIRPRRDVNGRVGAGEI